MQRFELLHKNGEYEFKGHLNCISGGDSRCERDEYMHKDHFVLEQFELLA
jgi:hypothetical protein